MKARLSLTLGLVLAAFSATAMSAQAGFCGVRAAGVEFVIDASSSMGEAFTMPQYVNSKEDAALWGEKGTKLDFAKRFVELASEKIASDTTMTTGVATLMPAANVLKTQKRTGKDFTLSVKDLKLTASDTTLNHFDKKALDFFAKKRPEPTTLFLITDGDIDKGSHDAVKVLQTFYQNNPKSCVHVISLAQNDTEAEMINRLRKAGVCSTMVTVADMISDRQKFNTMVEENVYRDCASKEDLEVSGIPFVKKSNQLDKRGFDAADKILDVIAQRPKEESMLILGWTDTEGDAAYNKRLGLQRAKAVKEYLMTKGVEDHRMAVMGAGESDKYDNSTEAGRKLNRRVDIIFGQ